MAWMWALTKVPWKTILLHAPTIVEAARRFYGTTQTPAAGEASGRRASDGIESLRRAVEELEEREAQQAALFADLARQVQQMATALDVLRARLLLALWGAGVAIALALVTVILVLLRAR